MKINFGYPEVLTLSGTFLLVEQQYTAGWIFCALGFVGMVLRFGIKVQQQEQKKKEMQELSGQIAEAGKKVLTVVNSLSNKQNDYH